MLVERSDPSLARSIVLEIEGPGATPSTIDAPIMLELAAAFFALVHGNARDAATSLTLQGLSVIDKCVGIMVPVDGIEDVLEFVERAKAQLLGIADAPRGLGQAAKRGRKALASLPSGQSARILVGSSWETGLSLDDAENISPLDSILSVRARVLRVGGHEPVVRFASLLEDDFTLHTTEQQTKALGAIVYREVDLCARVVRDSDGKIVRGRLETFSEVEGDDALAAWREWGQSAKANGWPGDEEDNEA